MQWFSWCCGYHINIVSSIPAVVKTAEEVADTAAGDAGGFVATPSNVIFTDYIPGKTYTVSCKHSNSPRIPLHIGKSTADQQQWDK